jgi:LuxR family transcriptional regulator, maltose regulon positive regulatory protein
LSSPNPNTSAWYVATKLQPPLVRSDIIRRPRIEEELCRFVSTLPLTLLSAPAGYGKTTLLSALPSLLPDYPLSWITLETEDNDPVRFIGLLATALQRLHSECGSSVWPMISGGEVSGSGMKHAVGILINDIVNYLPEPFILVLDDLHSVTEPAVYVALDYLLDQLPPNLHVAIGTRHDPPLRLARLAARRKMGELRRADFSLNQDETRRLLNDTLGLGLTTDEVTILQKRTEGWPGVLCLLAGPLERVSTLEHRTQFMAALTHTERQALDFLAEEIFLNLPKDIRCFLMQTSILAEMTPLTCQAVTGRDDAAEVLAELYRRNLAIASLTIDTEGEPVYRYHALFAQLLTQQLERELSREIVELHQRAAEVQKTPGRAISHYFSARLWDQAAQLMVRSGMQLLLRGMAETFRQWYGTLPIETRNRYSHLTILMARCEIHRGDYAAARRLLKEAREAFVAKGDTMGEGDALTSLITLSYESNDRMSAAAYVKRALQLPLNPMGQVAAQLAEAWLRTYDCDWEGACTSIRRGLAIPSATGDRRADITGITYMSAPLASLPGCLELTESYCAEVSSLSAPDTAWYLGAQELGTWPLLWWGQVEEALDRAKAAEDLRQRLGGYPFIGNDLPLLLSVLYLAKGDLDAAEGATYTLIQRVEKAGRSRMMLQMHAAGRSLALLGRYEEALVMLQRLEALLDDNFPLTNYLFNHLKGLLALLGRGGVEASAILQRASELEVQLPMARVGGSARLLQARLLLDQGNPDGAFAAAYPVLDEWNNASTPGCVLLDGPVILPILRLAAERNVAAATRMLGLFSGNLRAREKLTRVPADNVPIKDMTLRGQLPEPLTPRECDVLKLLIAGRTNIEISTELHVSTETVKSHVVRIFRKLDVHSRTQVVIRARELGF